MEPFHTLISSTRTCNWIHHFLKTSKLLKISEGISYEDQSENIQDSIKDINCGGTIFLERDLLATVGELTGSLLFLACIFLGFIIDAENTIL